MRAKIQRMRIKKNDREFWNIKENKKRFANTNSEREKKTAENQKTKEEKKKTSSQFFSPSILFVYTLVWKSILFYILI